MICMKSCPFKSGAVQAQAARLCSPGHGVDQERALAMARDQFGSCDQEGCQMWQGGVRGPGYCGLTNK